jgi:hypothetical protein
MVLVVHKDEVVAAAAASFSKKINFDGYGAQPAIFNSKFIKRSL